MKKLILYITITLIVFILDLFLVGMPKKESKELDKSKKQPDDIEYYELFSTAELAYNFSDSKIMAEHSDYIAIIKIDSTEGSNINRVTNESIDGVYTCGKARVLMKIKGNLDDDILFTRGGGTMPFNEWIKSKIDKDRIEKSLESGGYKSTKNLIVNDVIYEDIKIETGKIYLAYMIHNEEFNYENEYSIIGLQHGLREVKGLKIKNNNTGKWENIFKVIDIK